MTTTALRIEIPPVFCPIPSAAHPHAEALEERGVKWMTRHGFCRDPSERIRVIGSKAGEFFARASPEGIESHLQVAVDWAYHQFLFDDLCDAGSASRNADAFADLAPRIVRTLEAPESALIADRTMSGPLRDLARRSRRVASSVQRERLVEAHRRFIVGVTWAVACQSRGVIPDLNQYAALRLHSAGGPPVTAWLEIINGCEISAREMSAPHVRALTELTWLIASWDNDLVSYGKELWLFDRDDHVPSSRPLNLVEVLMAGGHAPMERALREGVAMRDCLMCRFLTLRERVLRRASFELTRYLTDLGHLIRGNFEWSLTNGRYRNPDGAVVDAVLPSSAFAPCPSRGAARPLAIPVIAWWWDDLDR